LAPDGRSKGWGTAVFATAQEAQHAIDTFDGWEVEGRVIKVRWDKFQGSTSQPSPQLGQATISSPQMMHAQLSPATPRPNDYAAIPSAAQPSWLSQYLPNSNLRLPSLSSLGSMQGLQPLHPLQSMQSLSGQSSMQSPTMTMAGHPSPYAPGYAQPQYIPQAQSSAASTSYPATMYPSGGWVPTSYNVSTLPPFPPPGPPHVRLPSNGESSGNGQQGQPDPSTSGYQMQSQ